MPLTVSESSSQNRVLPPEGTHIARCVELIDLGTQDDSYMGQPKVVPKVRITWELPLETHVFDEKKGEQPFVVSKEYTANLGEKANLRKDLDSWRGRSFTDEELKSFDLRNILGAPCQITIAHRLSKKSGNPYVDLLAVTKLAKGAACPEAVNPLVSYDVSEGRNGAFQKLHKFLQEKIEKCHEWRPKSEPDPAPEDEGTGDDIPF